MKRISESPSAHLSRLRLVCLRNPLLLTRIPERGRRWSELVVMCSSLIAQHRIEENKRCCRLYLCGNVSAQCRLSKWNAARSDKPGMLSLILSSHLFAPKASRMRDEGEYRNISKQTPHKASSIIDSCHLNKIFNNITRQINWSADTACVRAWKQSHLCNVCCPIICSSWSLREL